jgi:YjbE family integral membrane protein
MASWLPVLGSIVLVDLVLSGDNALVIGAVASGIPKNLRWVAFVAGGGGAILLRVLLTYSVTLLLHIPYIEVFGGVILILITIRLLWQRDDGNRTGIIENTEVKDDKKGNRHYFKKDNTLGAILTIVIADVTMSLDNVIAIAALAKYQAPLLIIGLVISIILLLVGSAFVSLIIDRLGWLMWIVGFILAVTAANMIVNNNDVFGILPNEQPWWSIVIYIVVFVTIAVLTIFYPGFRYLRKRRSHSTK